MEQRLRFGIMTLQIIPWPALLERWQWLDRSIFDSAWVADHFVPSRSPDAPWLEGWTVLAALASQTTRMGECHSPQTWER